MVNNIEVLIKKTQKLPTKIKSAFEYLSGYSLENVRVHYDSDKPQKVGAHAYAQGNDIYLAPGKEEHLAHEAWHIVQQKQGRVKATSDIDGILINSDPALEQEADAMATKIASFSLNQLAQKASLLFTPADNSPVAQLAEIGGDAEDEDDSPESLFPFLTIVPEMFDEDHLERKKSYRKVRKEDLRGVDALNAWLSPTGLTLSTEDIMLNDLIGDKMASKALGYHKYLTNEKQHFCEKWKSLTRANLDARNILLYDNEEDCNLDLERFGLKNMDADANSRIEISGSGIFYAYRKVEALKLTPYIHMTPFTEDFIGFSPIPGRIPLKPRGINSKSKQIICATSAMASLCGYIKATDDTEKALAGCIQFMNDTHVEGLQVNAGSLETARGFAINLAKTKKRKVSPIFKASSNPKEMRDGEKALDDYFWSNIYPNLKADASVYYFQGTTHVVSIIKINNESYLKVASNTKSRGDRSVHVEVQSIKPKKVNVGFGFIISEPI